MNSFSLRARYSGFTLAAEAAWDEPRTALFGASGAGKSTVLEALSGLRREVRGEVVLGGQRIDELRPEARGVAWVPQDAGLFPHLTVAENLSFGARRAKAEMDLEARDEAIAAMEIEELLERRPKALSGGERQRVAIARALASRPRFLLLDEPLASIDRPLRARLVPYLEAWPDRAGVPFLLVTHDPLEVLALARHVLVLEGGRIVRTGAPREVFAAPEAFGALHALGAENRFAVSSVRVEGGTFRVETARGSRLTLARVAGFPDPSRVAIRSEDVLLAQNDPGPVSAQNVFVAEVTSLEPVGEQVLVHLRTPGPAAGEPWVAKVTQDAVRSLGVAPGRRFHLLIKAHAIQPEA